MHINRTPEWKKVTPPSGWTWELPFDIQKRGRKFRPDPNFNLQSYAGITVNKTYYVDKSIGNDSNTGIDWNNALKTLSAAAAKTDVDRIIIRDSYFFRSECPVFLDRNIEIIGQGDVQVTSCINNEITTGWTLVGNHYEATVTNYRYAAGCTDQSMAGIGNYTPFRSLNRMASIEEVDNNAGTFWQSASALNRTLYLRLPDDRIPDEDVKFYESTAINYQQNRTIYIENIVSNSFRIRNNGGVLRFFAKNCRGTSLYRTGFQIDGAFISILQDCQSYYGGDAVNYGYLNDIGTRSVEIDCEFGHCGSGSSDQASTGHTNCIQVRLNGTYHHTSGQNISEQTSTASWLLGCTMHDSNKLNLYAASAVGFNSPPNSWLDSCTIYNNDIDIAVTAGTCRIRNIVSGGNYIGTVQEY